jgi:hypothetical protein
MSAFAITILAIACAWLLWCLFLIVEMSLPNIRRWLIDRWTTRMPLYRLTGDGVELVDHPPAILVPNTASHQLRVTLVTEGYCCAAITGYCRVWARSPYSRILLKMGSRTRNDAVEDATPTHRARAPKSYTPPHAP